MKLAQKYNRVNLLTSLVVLIITGGIYYTIVHFILTEKLDKDLVIEENEIIAYSRTYKRLPLASDFLDQTVSYGKFKNQELISRDFFNEEYFNSKKNKKEPGRTLVSNLRLNGSVYKVSITKSRVETEDLVRIIFLITFGVVILLLLSLLFISRLVFKSLWKPFYATLAQMKAFSLASNTEIIVEQSKIDEFNELIAVVDRMSTRVKDDYKELKRFTDTTSHEMMTPLAVINSKLDLLLQDEPLNQQQGELVEDIYLAVGKLTRLNQSLLLLVKIENRLIQDKEEFDLKELIEQKLRQFNELLQNKEIKLCSQLESKMVSMNKYLADILLNNLFSNAIRHNHQKGSIELLLNQRALIFTNTGFDSELDHSQTFERFYKSPLSEGTGLGLTIMKQIATLYHFELKYTFHQGKHSFDLTF